MRIVVTNVVSLLQQLIYSININGILILKAYLQHVSVQVYNLQGDDTRVLKHVGDTPVKWKFN
jgi:hypothetical protein